MKSKPVPMTAKAVANLQQLYTAIKNMLGTLETLNENLASVQAAYGAAASLCTHTHPNGKSAFKMRKCGCGKCNAKFKQCQICHACPPEPVPHGLGLMPVALILGPHGISVNGTDVQPGTAGPLDIRRN